ncbi:MAG TPA: response regulator [Polyangiales bacterium]
MGTPTESAVPPRVFVVDDDPLVLAVTRRVLARAGYEVALFEDPRRALAELERAQPFAVVADLNMPELGGSELLELVKQASPRSLRVLYTGEGQVQELMGKLAPGLVHAVLPKAAGMQSLPDTLERLRSEA